MISSVEIKNFRGIREGKLEEFGPLVVLVGPNGSGKSTILDALLIGASPETPAAVVQAVTRRQAVSGEARWLFWRAGDSPSSIILKSTGGLRECQLKCRQLGSLKRLQIDGSIKDQPGDRLDGGRFSAMLLDDGTWNYQEFSAPLPNVPSIRIVDAASNHRESPLHQVYTLTVEQGRRDEANNIISAAVPGATDVTILTAGDSPVVHLVFNDHSVPVGLAGDGVHSLVRLALELASRPHGVVLLEEPEVHQHPRAMRQTARAILAAVRRDIQVILTTHSLELIDSLLGEFRDEEELEKLSLYRVELEDGLLKSCRHPGKEVAFARGTIEDDLR